MQSTLEQLSEHVVANPSQVDRAKGIIYGVKIIGRISRNGREYTASALQRAAGLYENKQVNINHPDRNNPHADRQVHDRFGKLQNIQIRKSGLFGDLHFLKSHPLAEQVCETAERMPDVLGLSHNVDGRIVRKNGKSIVEDIERVISVDLVCDPASTSGLFESVNGVAGLAVENNITSPQNGKEMAQKLSQPGPKWQAPAHHTQRQNILENEEIRTNMLNQAMDLIKRDLDNTDLPANAKTAAIEAVHKAISIELQLIKPDKAAQEWAFGESYDYHLKRAKFSPVSRRIVERFAVETTRSPQRGAEMARQLR